MRTEKPRLAAIYARVSTQEQATGEVASLDTQVAECRAKAATLGIPIAPDEQELIVQEVHSGTDLLWQGTQFMGLVRRAQLHEFTDLICLNVDRFCRAGANIFQRQMGYFADAGVVVHFVQVAMPEDMPFRDSVQGVIADAADYWRKGIVEASVRVRTAYAKAGNLIPGATPPFGWKFVEDPTRQTRRGKPVKIGLVSHEDNAPILLHMYHHVAAGGSNGELRRWLEERGIRTPKGAPVWHEATIRRILHNPTNWGERRSFYMRRVKDVGAAHRPANVKSNTKRVMVPEDEQYEVDPTVIERIPGLTRDLAMRVLAILEQNQGQHALAVVQASETERAERGLLFGGMVRCSTCGGGMRVKHNPYNWLYYCAHTGTEYVHEPSLSISTNKLDPIVWNRAVYAVRDPGYFERLANAADEVAGPVALAKSLERQLEEAQRDRDLKRKHWLRLDPEDPIDAAIMGGAKAELAQAENRVRELTEALEAMRSQVDEEEARRTTLIAFRNYAASQREHLDTKTPLEKHQLLRALGTRIRLSRNKSGDPVVRIAFDIRHLPGAAGKFRPNLQDERAHTIIGAMGEEIVVTQVELVQREGATPFQRRGGTVQPITPGERAAMEADERRTEEQMAEYRAWLKANKLPDTLANFEAWYNTEFIGQPASDGDILEPEPQNGSAPQVRVKRTRS